MKREVGIEKGQIESEGPEIAKRESEADRRAEASVFSSAKRPSA